MNIDVGCNLATVEGVAVDVVELVDVLLVGDAIGVVAGLVVTNATDNVAATDEPR